MKRTIIACLLFALLLACVPTPDEEFVVNKSDGTLEEKLSSDPVSEFTTETDTQEAVKSPLYDALGAPERWTMEAQTRSVPFADLTVYADAAVVLPNVTTVPVYQTSGKGFSKATLDAVADALLGDGARYELEQGFLKAQWEERIKEAQKHIEYIQTCPEPYEGWREEELEQMQEQLRGLSEQYTNAPKDYACAPWSGSYQNGCMTRISDGVYAKLHVWGDRFVFSVTSYRSVMAGLYSNGPDRADSPEADEACAVVKAFLERAGCADAYTIARVQGLSPAAWLQESENEISGYEVSLLPVYGGITVAPYWTAHGSDTAQQKAVAKGIFEELDYDAVIGPEIVSVIVEDGRIVLVDWSHHYERGDCINENVQLLPFAEVEQAIKNAVFTEHFLDEGVNETVKIARIELNMMRVKQRDTKDTYYFLPVWDVLFYEPDSVDTEPTRFLTSYVTINAIDGTRIDRTRGY